MDEKTKKEVLKAYQTGTQSLQDIARIYNVDINEVLVATGNADLAHIDFQGDLIDQAEAGPNTPLKGPQKTNVPFSLN